MGHVHVVTWHGSDASGMTCYFDRCSGSVQQVPSTKQAAAWGWAAALAGQVLSGIGGDDNPEGQSEEETGLVARAAGRGGPTEEVMFE